MKNLFFTTHRNPVRKVFEYTLAPLADWILGKRRILELYLNVIEWGPGVFGAAAASRLLLPHDACAAGPGSIGETCGLCSLASSQKTRVDGSI